MTECCVEPSTSRVAIAAAFNRARRKFPKNFGASPNALDYDQSSEVLNITFNLFPKNKNNTKITSNFSFSFAKDEDALSISKNITESECNNRSDLQKSPPHHMGSVVGFSSRIDSPMEAVIDATDKLQNLCDNSEQDLDDAKLMDDSSVLVLLAKDDRLDEFDRSDLALVEQSNDLKT